MNELAKIKVTSDPADSHSLPGWAYLKPELFERERHEIFFRTWHYAGWIGDLQNTGDYITAELLDQSVIILRAEDGTLQGFHNVCLHRGHQLLTGQGHVNAIACPYHAWVYRLDGQLRNARGAERQPNFDTGQFRMRPVRVDLFAGLFVFFNLDMDAPSLDAVASDMMADVVAETPRLSELVRADVVARGGTRPMFPCAANWKVVMDNFLECNHCSASHPGFADIVDMRSYRTYAAGEWSTQRGATRADGHKMQFWWLFPTTTIALDADPDNFSFVIGSFTTPKSVALSEVGRSHLYRLPGMDTAQPRGDVFGTMTALEDRLLCESVQRGLASIGYESGRIIHDAEGRETTEIGIHRFHSLVVEKLGL